MRVGDIPRPPGWEVLKEGIDGVCLINRDDLKVIVSLEGKDDGCTWLHASCSRQDRMPSYGDLCLMKDTFIGPQRKAVQIFAPRAEHVSIHSFCLHLWCCLDRDPLPDMTCGTGSI
jgi:hypothetical protein